MIVLLPSSHWNVAGVRQEDPPVRWLPIMEVLEVLKITSFILTLILI